MIRQRGPLASAPGFAAAVLGAFFIVSPLQQSGPVRALTPAEATATIAAGRATVGASVVDALITPVRTLAGALLPEPAAPTAAPLPIHPGRKSVATTPLMAAASAAVAAPASPPAQPASSPASGSPAEPRPAASTSPFPRAAGKDSPTPPSAVTALILIQGEQRGSGVLLRRSAGGTWLVTNRHVVDGHEQVCVRTADGRLWPGIPLLPARASSLDLAFVWLGDTADALPVAVPAAMPASAAAGNRQAWNFAIVRASGYPVREERLPAPPSYREVQGLLLPLLRRPLEGGLQLASTSPVRKGMSGGGLFDAQGRLIGLNATHADPLWSAPLREEGGKALPPELNRQLELVALAIPVSRILPLLADLEPPGRLARMTQTPTALRRGRAPLDRTLFSVPAAEQRATVAPVCTGGLW